MSFPEEEMEYLKYIVRDRNVSGGEPVLKGLAYALERLGHDVETVPQEGLQGRPDDQI